jgi:HSP20 family protein
MEAPGMLLHRLTDTGLLNSLREVENIRSRLNHLLTLDSANELASPTFPPLNTWLSDEGAIVTAELPGMQPTDLDINVVNDTLTIKGSREAEKLSEGETMHRCERGTGSFSRSLQLPFKIEAEKVDAKFCKGILEIKLPRAESEKPKKISVRSN